MINTITVAIITTRGGTMNVRRMREHLRIATVFPVRYACAHGWLAATTARREVATLT